jgi:Domain of unknown function (DUF4440)
MSKQFFLFVLFVFLGGNLVAQSNIETAVAASVDAWRTATMTADKATLEKILSDKLTYGHSSGNIEGKASFIESIMTGKSTFLTMDLTKQRVAVIDKKTAIVRHNLDAKTKNSGVDGTAKLHIMTIWQKEGGTWRMVGRQACKLP